MGYDRRYDRYRYLPRIMEEESDKVTQVGDKATILRSHFLYFGPSFFTNLFRNPEIFATQKFASQTRCFTCFVKQLPQTELFQSYLWTLYLPSDQGFQHLKLVGQDLVWVPQIDVSTQLVEAPFFDWAPRLIVPGALQRPKGGKMGGGREFLRDL